MKIAKIAFMSVFSDALDVKQYFHRNINYSNRKIEWGGGRRLWRSNLIIKLYIKLSLNLSLSSYRTILAQVPKSSNI